ncbi:MAG: lipopolysaccharide biosynthesis protein [Ignavibacteriae bacterium]|nr:lipopolysaccharide biosynthesis protein [Ignavibacteriota bacterium]MCB0752988.1 lipopolysaccharide biosynthesis protein [Ignavibacteriota bacterium]
MFNNFKKVINKAVIVAKGSNFKNVSKMLLGTLSSQVILFLLAPILYRIYDKVDYGTIGQFMALNSFALVFVTLQLNYTILIEDSEYMARNAIKSIHTIVTACVLILLLIILPIKQDISTILGNPDMNYWLIFIPFTVYLNSRLDAFKTWANRKEEYSVFGKTLLLEAIIGPLISIPYGLYYKTGTGLFLGFFISLLVSNIFIYRCLKEKPPIGFNSFIRTKFFVIKNKFYPLFQLPSQGLKIFSEQLPLYLLSIFTSPEMIGIYNLSVRVVNLPFQVISSSMSSVYNKRLVESYNLTENSKRIFTKMLLMLFSIGIIPLIVVYIFGVPLFSWYFGEKWSLSGKLSSVLVVLYFFRFIYTSLSYSFILTRKQIYDLFFTILILATSCLVLYVGLSTSKNLIETLKTYSIIISLILIFATYFSFTILPKNNNQV